MLKHHSAIYTSNKKPIRRPRKEPVDGTAVARERVDNRTRQQARGRYISQVMRELNNCIAGLTNRFAIMRPVFIVDLNDPSCVTVQFFDGQRDLSLQPCVLTNRRLYGKNRFWGTVEQQPIAGKWKLKFTRQIGADTIINTEQLLFEIRLDLGELNCSEERLDYYFGKYRKIK